MDPALQIELSAQSHQSVVDNAIRQGNSPVQRFYNNSTIFLTGVTGFIGKQLLEKLIRTCNLKKVYVLMRSKIGKNIKDRLKKVLEDPIYDTLRKKNPQFSELIHLIEGDLMESELGISDTDRQLLINEMNVIFHGAATVSFDEPIKSATLTNVRGTREILRLAEMCQNLRSFTYISTAYCNATVSRCDSQILEKFYPPPMSPDLLIDLVENLDGKSLDEINFSKIFDWPNNYTFTKVIAEELVRTNNLKVPVTVIRPTIVIGSRREPYPGWMDKNSILGPTGIIVGSSMGVLHVLQSRYEIKIDFISVDIVTNTAIASVVSNSNSDSNSDVTIYHVGTSCSNHLTWGELVNLLKYTVRKTVISPKAVWYCFVVESPRAWLAGVYVFALHTVPAYLVDGLCWVIRKPRRFRKLYAKVNKLGSVLTFYTTHNWIFVDTNTSNLHQSLSPNDKLIFQCDTTNIDWKEMILLWCVGARRYVIQDGLKGTMYGRKKQLFYRIMTYLFGLLFIYLVLLLVSKVVGSLMISFGY